MKDTSTAIDLRKMLNAMSVGDIEATAEALFGKPTGIPRVDKELITITAEIVDRRMKRDFTSKDISDQVQRELQQSSGCFRED